MAKKITKEEKVAFKMSELVNDVTLDLDMVGWYMAKATPTILMNRISLVLESAICTKEEDNEHQY
jgi:hypothetical protein